MEEKIEKEEAKVVEVGVEKVEKDVAIQLEAKIEDKHDNKRRVVEKRVEFLVTLVYIDLFNNPMCTLLVYAA